MSNAAESHTAAAGLTDVPIPADLLRYLEEIFFPGLPDGPQFAEIIPAIREGRPLHVDSLAETRVSEQLAAEIIGIDSRTMLKLLDDGTEGLPYTGKFRGARMLTLGTILAFRRQRQETQHRTIGDIQALTAELVN